MKKILLALIISIVGFIAPVLASTCFWVPLVVTGAVSGTGGLCRLTVNSTAGLLAGDAVIVAGILGSTACDGTTTVTTVVSGTLVEVNLSFNTLYTSGGTVAGGRWTTTNTGNWASATGGTVATCAATGGVPKQAADTATFDGSSGGGIVFPDSTINGITLTQITMGAFTGTLDFSVNNPSITLSTAFSNNGSGTRTLKLGSGTYTLTATVGTIWDHGVVTGLTFLAGTSTITCTTAPLNIRTFVLGAGITFNTITLSNGSATSGNFEFNLTGNGAIITTLNLIGPIFLVPGTSFTITNAFNPTGSAYNSGILISAIGSRSTITLTNGGTFNWISVGSVAWAGSPTATNSFDLKGNTGITITGPAGSGGGHIIGG